MKYFVTLLAFAATSISFAKAQAFGPEAANAACKGFPADTIICVSQACYPLDHTYSLLIAERR